MNRESVELGFILKRIDGYNFSIKTFQDRLYLQKLIYLLQAFGVYLGYDFSWHVRGPYCSLLLHNSMCLEEIYEKIPDGIKLKDKKSRKDFKRFRKFVKGKNLDELEFAVTLHYTKNVEGACIPREVSEAERKEGKHNNIWREMEECQLI